MDQPDTPREYNCPSCGDAMTLGNVCFEAMTTGTWLDWYKGKDLPKSGFFFGAPCDARLIKNADKERRAYRCTECLLVMIPTDE